MAFDHKDVLTAQAQQLHAERAKALGDYEAGRIAEDSDATMYAADRIIETDAKLAALNNIAGHLVASQQRPAGNKYGLSKDEIEVAHGLASGDRSMTNDQREQTYAWNRQRYWQARRDGSYRDDQGRVTR